MSDTDPMTPRQGSNRQGSPRQGWSRRTLLSVSTVAAATAALAGGGYYWMRRGRFGQLSASGKVMAETMAQRLEGLELDVDDAIVERWVQDYLAFGGSAKLRKDKKSGQLRVTRAQVESLLMSTDILGEGDGRVNRYVAHYNPHKNPCYNPCNRPPPTG